MLLACALHILLPQFVTQDEFNCAELCLVQFVAKVPALYGLEHCSYNCHLLTHLTQSARDWGLLWTNSAFVFEDMNGKLLQLYSGTQSVSSQIFKHFFSYQKVIRKENVVLQDSSREMQDFFFSLTSCNIATKSSNYIRGHLVTLGCGSHRLLTAREIAAPQNSCTLTGYQHRNSVTQYKRCVYNSMLVATRDCSVNFKRNNSVIETANCFGMVESLVVVPKPCNCERGSNCSCREFLIFYKKLLREHRRAAIYDAEINTNIAKFLVKVRISNELCAMTCEDIVAKCIAIEHEGQLYVIKMPVFETS